MNMLAQLDIPALTGDPKTWLTIIGGLLATMVVGRFVQAFRTGAGLIDAAKAVLFGTNVPAAAKPTPPATGQSTATDSSSGNKTVVLLFLLGALTLAVLPLLTGCTTTQQGIALKSLGTVETATTGAYDGYLDSVIKGISSTNGLPRVSKAYNTFQASFLIALDAVQFNTNAIAPASLVVESEDVLNLIANVKGK